MEKLDLSRKNLKKFGLIMGAVFFAIAIYMLLRHKRGILPASILSALFLSSAFILPMILKPFYFFWMRLAFILSWINTRLILTVIFYLIFSPAGLLIRLFGKDLLKRGIDRKTDSYWLKKEDGSFKRLDYERQF